MTDPEKAAQEARAALAALIAETGPGQMHPATACKVLMPAADAAIRLAVIAGQVRLLEDAFRCGWNRDQRMFKALRAAVLRGDHAEGGEG